MVGYLRGSGKCVVLGAISGTAGHGWRVCQIPEISFRRALAIGGATLHNGSFRRYANAWERVFSGCLTGACAIVFRAAARRAPGFSQRAGGNGLFGCHPANFSTTLPELPRTKEDGR